MGKSGFQRGGADRAKAKNYGRVKNDRDEEDNFDRLVLDLTQGVSITDALPDNEVGEDANDPS